LFYLILALVFNVIVSAVLKLFAKFDVNALQAIVVNYCTCVITGWIFTGETPVTPDTFNTPWFFWAVLLGISFIIIFNLTAYCTKVDGMTTTIMASKLSLIIPVVCSVALYNESIGLIKLTGILLAFPAVYLSTRAGSEDKVAKSLLWPALLFVLSGSLDTLVNFVQTRFLATPADQAAGTIMIFAVAGLTGLTILAALSITGKVQFAFKNVIAGVALGIPNFFSIYFLVKGLNSGVFQSSATIPLFNISVLVFTSLVAIVFFKERANKLQITGLLLATVAILLIAFGD
jgi:drug/metabolite transporter (DMT)-like permease